MHRLCWPAGDCSTRPCRPALQVNAVAGKVSGSFKRLSSSVTGSFRVNSSAEDAAPLGEEQARTLCCVGAEGCYPRGAAGGASRLWRMLQGLGLTLAAPTPEEAGWG